VKVVKCFHLSLLNHALLRCFLLLCLISSLQAQESAQGLLNKATESLNSGNFKESAQTLQDLITKFPKDRNAPNARYLLGISNYSMGNYAEAVKNLTDTKDFLPDTLPIAAFHLGTSHFFLGNTDQAITALTTASKSTNKEIVPFSILYLARAYMDRGSKLLATDKGKAAAAFDAGLAQINDLITKYPQDPNMTDAYMTKASLNALAGKYDAAAATLEDLKTKPGGAEVAEDADYLLGYVYTQQTQGLLAEYKNEEAAQTIQKARATYQRLQKSDNLLIANDAAYQLANLSFADKKYEQALTEFRALRSKEEVLTSQKARINDLRGRLSASAANKEQVSALQRLLQREEAKLKSVNDNADTSLDSLIRVGDCYRQLRKYDEARTVYRQAMKFAAAEKLKDLNLQIIVTQALQGLGEKADAGFEEFKKKFPNDPMAEGVPFFIATALIKQERFDEAQTKLRDIIKNSPNSKYAALSVQELARTLIGQKKPEEALKLIQDFATQVKTGKFKLPPDVLEEAEFFRGATLFQIGKKEEAVTVMKDLAATSKNAAIKQNASYETAKMLNNMGKAEDTIKAMQDFITAYPDSPNADKALVSIAGSYEKLSKTEEALKAYRDIITKTDDPAVKIFALEKTWRIHLATDRYDDMVKVQDELSATYPESPRSLVALSERARYLEKIKKTEEAAAVYQQLTDRYEKLSPEAQKEPFGKTLGSYVVRNLQRQADADFKAATRLGAPAAMDEAKKAQWKQLLTSSNQTLDKAIQEFPGTDILGILLKNKVDIMLLMIRNQLMDQEAAFTYLSQLAGTQQDETLKAQVLITRASLAYQLGQKSVATRLYKDALSQISNPLSISWQEYERYGSILLEDKQWDEALIQFQKLRESFAKPDAAQAAAIYGLGASYLGKKDTAKAQQLFSELKQKYPQSDKLLEAEFSQALLSMESAKYEEGFAALKKVMNSGAASNQTRARALVEFGKALEAMGAKGIKTKETYQGEGKPDQDIFKLAGTYYERVPLLYTSQPELCAEALYHLVNLKINQKKKDEALKYATELSTKYPASEWADKVQSLLK
jgi:TolA-binding protein